MLPTEGKLKITSQKQGGATHRGRRRVQQPPQAAKAQISQRSRGTAAKRRKTEDNTFPLACTSTMSAPGVSQPLAASLTQSGKRGGGAPLLAEEHKLLREHGVAALRHEAGPEPGALLSHGAGGRRQLLEPFDGLQRKSQAVFLHVV